MVLKFILLQNIILRSALEVAMLLRRARPPPFARSHRESDCVTSAAVATPHGARAV